MDKTILFKACVKTVRTTNKNLGVKDSKTDILKSKRDVHLTKAKEIITQIGKLQDILQESKVAYLNVLNYLSTNKTMTEMDRQEIDALAQKIIISCTTNLSTYKQEINKLSKSSQKQEHYGNILDSIEKYLKAVSKLYAESKAKRVKKVIETHKLSKLETRPTNKVNMQESEPIITREIISLPQPVIENIENQLSSEELQMFESENDYLFEELNSLSDEVRQIENKVVHISELQELFTDKVLQQDLDIDRIATTIATSTDNMKDANEQIRQAIQRNAGLRVWVLFFLLIMSFSLLFLDWYND